MKKRNDKNLYKKSKNIRKTKISEEIISDIKFPGDNNYTYEEKKQNHAALNLKDEEIEQEHEEAYYEHEEDLIEKDIDEMLEKHVKNPYKKLKRLIIILAAAVILFFVGRYTFNEGYEFVLKQQEHKNRGYDIEVPEEDRLEIVIKYGDYTKDISNTLYEQNVIDNKFLFNIWSLITGYENKYKSGIHYINKNEDYNNLDGYEKLMHILSKNPPKSPEIKLTIYEGSTYAQTAEVFIKQNLTTSDDFLKACNNEEFDYDFIKQIPENEDRICRLEGYLFPDTYIFDITGGEKHFIEKMLANFENKFRSEFIKRAEKMGITIDQAIIIASLIEREAAVDEERDIIASVIYNRLNNEDKNLRKLQIDATLQYYYIMTTGSVKEQIMIEDTWIDHPYNTYKYEGLPPGPICSPGEASIIAALYPAETDYLYYVSKGDGTHAFSKTLEEHEEAKERYGVIY